MRIVYFTLFITVLIVGFSIFSVYAIEESAMDMVRVLEEVEKAVKEQDWLKAHEKTAELEEKWKNNLFLWTLLLEHSEIDNIQLSIVHIRSFIETGEYSQVRAEIAGLFTYLKHIPENEKLTLRNIF